MINSEQIKIFVKGKEINLSDYSGIELEEIEHDDYSWRPNVFEYYLLRKGKAYFRNAYGKMAIDYEANKEAIQSIKYGEKFIFMS